MGIREKYEIGIGDDRKPELSYVWELDVLGNILLLERYRLGKFGFCDWDEIKLKNKGCEVYRIVKCDDNTPNPKNEERKEYFLDQLTRTYFGDQFSFIEYIALIAKQERFPSAEEYVQAGLDPNVESLYRNNLQKILNVEILKRN